MRLKLGNDQRKSHKLTLVDIWNTAAIKINPKDADVNKVWI